MNKEELEKIRSKNEFLKSIKAGATPAPWFIQENDDIYSMNMSAVSTNSTPQSFRTNSNNYDASVVIALTLVQQPAYAAVADGRWNENAELIVQLRNSGIEEDVDLLIEEIERLKREIDRLSSIHKNDIPILKEAK